MYLFYVLVWFFLPFFPIYYWIAFDEMKGQHRVRRVIYLIIVPLCVALVLFTSMLSLIPMMSFIALGEAFDKPKPSEKKKAIKMKLAQKILLCIMLGTSLILVFYPVILGIFSIFPYSLGLGLVIARILLFFIVALSAILFIIMDLTQSEKRKKGNKR